MFSRKSVVFMSAFLLAAPFGLNCTPAAAYPGESLVEGARDIQEDMHRAKSDLRDLRDGNSDRGRYDRDRYNRDRDRYNRDRDRYNRDRDRYNRDRDRYDRDRDRYDRDRDRYDRDRDRDMRRHHRDDMFRHDNGRHEGWKKDRRPGRNGN